MNTIISSRKVIEFNNLSRIVNSIHFPKLSKSLVKNIIRIALYTNKNYGSRNKKFAYLTTLDFYKEIYGNYDPKNPTHTKKLKDIQSVLNILSTNYSSIYNKNNVLLEKHENAYSFFSKNNGIYFPKRKYLPKLFTLGSSSTTKNEIKNFEKLVLCCSIVIALKNNLIFRQEQIDNMFGISSHDFKNTLSEIGIKLIEKQTLPSSFEKKYLEVRSKVPRGCYFTENDVNRASNFLNKHNIRLDWKNLFLLRMSFYTNQNHLSKEWFENIDDIVQEQLNKRFGKNTIIERYNEKIYNELCSVQTQKNQIINYYRHTYDSCIPNSSKVAHFQNVFVTGIRDNRNKSSKSEYDNKVERGRKIHEDLKPKPKPSFDAHDGQIETITDSPIPRETEQLLSQSFLAKVAKLKTFEDFCECCRQEFENCCKMKKTLSVWLRFKNELLFALQSSNNPSKDIYIKRLNDVQSLEETLTSPIFNKDFINFLDLNRKSLKHYCNEREDELNGEKTFLSELEFQAMKNKLRDELGSAFFSDQQFNTIVNKFLIKEKQKIYMKSKQKEQLLLFKKSLINDIKNKNTKKTILEKFRQENDYIESLKMFILDKKIYKTIDEFKSEFNSWYYTMRHNKDKDKITSLFNELNYSSSNSAWVEVISIIRKTYKNECNNNLIQNLYTIENSLKQRTIEENTYSVDENLLNKVKSLGISIEHHSDTIRALDMKIKLGILKLNDVSIKDFFD